MATPKDLIFTMTHQFTLYLQRCGVRRDILGPDQLREMERAFYGGLGQMFFLITQDAAGMKQRDQIQVLESIQKQIEDFWVRELAIQSGLRIVCASCGWRGPYGDLLPRVQADLPKCPNCQRSDGLHYDDESSKRIT